MFNGISNSYLATAAVAHASKIAGSILIMISMGMIPVNLTSRDPLIRITAKNMFLIYYEAMIG